MSSELGRLARWFSTLRLLDERGLIKKVVLQNSLVSWANIDRKRPEPRSARATSCRERSRSTICRTWPPGWRRCRFRSSDRSMPRDRRFLLPGSEKIYAGCIERYGASGALEIR